MGDPTRSHLESMGLRLEPTARLRLIDGLLVVILLLSGAAWLWISVAGSGAALVALLNTAPGRIASALIGVASVLFVARSLARLRWPASDDDRSL